jgi:hypothetical protein
MNTAARVDWGRWIADCPADGCSDAVGLELGRTSIVCAAGHPSTVVWPSDKERDAIWAALARRPAAKNRHWFPHGHPMAAATGNPDGQTPADLDEETDAHLQAAAEQHNLAAQIGRLIAGAGPVSLDDLGISLADDGTITLGKGA